VPTALLIVGLVALVLAANACAPRRDSMLLAASFFAGWYTIELAPHLLVIEAVATVALVAAGGLADPVGWIGLTACALGVAGTVTMIVQSWRTTATLRECGVELDLDPAAAPTFPRRYLITPAAVLIPRRGVRVIRGVRFHERLKLDVFQPREDGTEGARRPGVLRPGALRPGIIQIHGGAWVIGGRNEQGLPLLNHLAAGGWVGFNIEYRLSPKATWPDHLVDVKRAIAWYREHAAAYGADPDFLVVTGGSAGGHLAAMAALTAGDPEYQPGFEAADTTVRAAVPFYGAYDLVGDDTQREPRSLLWLVERLVMKRRRAEDPEAYAKASPITRVRPDAPPFFVIHGTADSLLPVGGARRFVARLREVSEAPVVYAELKGAQHAFDIFPSYRTARVVETVERHLSGLHQRYLTGAEPETSDDSGTSAASNASDAAATSGSDEVAAAS
jgi:acetyl esterase/lipase